MYTPTDEKLLDEPRDEVTIGVLPNRPMVQDRLNEVDAGMAALH